jgi:hypothetical protein
MPLTAIRHCMSGEIRLGTLLRSCDSCVNGCCEVALPLHCSPDLALQVASDQLMCRTSVFFPASCDLLVSMVACAYHRSTTPVADLRLWITIVPYCLENTVETSLVESPLEAEKGVWYEISGELCSWNKADKGMFFKTSFGRLVQT